MMRMMFTWLLLAGLLGLAPLARTMMVAVPEIELINTSDLVIVGTVQIESYRLAEHSGLDGVAVVRVDRVLRGEVAGNISIAHAMPPITPPGVVIMDHGGFTLTKGQQRLFFLSRYRTGYSLVGGFQGMRDPAEADAFAQKLANQPLKVAVAAPVGPFYFGHLVPVTMTITNAGDSPATCHPPVIESFFYSPRMGNYLTFVLKPESQPGVIGMPAAPVTTLGPKSAKTITVRYTCQMPQSWTIFSPDTYLLTPIAMRVKISTEMPNAGLDLGRQRGFFIASPWVETLVGFPPPK